MDALMTPWLGQPTWMWLVFITLVVALLAFDLGILDRLRRRRADAAGVAVEDQVIGIGSSLKLSAFYIAVALAFGGWVWATLGPASGMAYLTGFALEKALALDNVFVISVIFASFAIPRHLQHRVLFWGILGVIVLRGVMIGLGTALVTQFDWIMWIFGAFLLLTGVKLLRGGDDEAPDMANHPAVRFLRRFLPISPKLDGQKFLTRLPDATGRLRLHATPLLLALLVVEFADVIFAVDSIPAIFAITQDPFIVYTSNIFAILGLRALYFALAAMVHRFEALKPALALVLVFIGAKIFYAQFFGKVDPAISLTVTLGILGGGVLLSLWRTRNDPTPDVS